METKIDYDTNEIRPTEIHVASDHAGFEMKEIIVAHLEKNHFEVVDHGPYEYDESDDYPDLIAPAMIAVSQDPQSKGIILGGSGQGEAMVANRIPRIRALLFNGQPEGDVPNVVTTARQHNDANVLSLGARFLTNEDALTAVDDFLETNFSGEERHVRRIQKLEGISNLIG